MNVSSSEADSTPHLPHESPGSSVSSRLMDEYEELLKYAVVVPAYDPRALPRSISDVRGSFPFATHDRRETPKADIYEHEESTLEEEEVQHLHGDEEEEHDADVESHDGDTLPPGVKHPAESTPLNMSHHEMPKEERPRSPIQLTEVDKMLARQVFHGRPGSPTSSVSSHGNMNQFADTAGYSITVDQDITKMEGLMDTWTLELKRNVLAEFSQMKIRLMEQYRQNVQKEREKVSAEGNRLQNEMEGLKELLHTYEQSIERKDQVISNLTRAMQQQKDRFEMAKTFCEWKIRHNDVKREAFASNLARKHYEKSLSKKVWDGWHSIIESKWRNRVEKACQAKAQEVCMQLTNDYETRIASLNEALESSRTEVERLHRERDTYEETMKKAFMRGVCALNLEAMNMFHEAGEQTAADDAGADVLDDGMMEANLDAGIPPSMMGLPGTGSYSSTVQHEPIFSMEPPGAPIPRVVTSQGAQARVQHAPPKSMTAGKTRGGKVISAKVTGRSEHTRSGQTLGGGSLGGGLAPPMSSVLVERHQPVTKQTIGHATASRFPRTAAGHTQQSGILHRKIAGQAGKVPIVTTNVQTIKMVE